MGIVNVAITKNPNLKSGGIGISSPWVCYYRELVALFGNDPDITISYDEDDLVVRLYVDGQEKADALSQLLPDKVGFGNVSLTISVIPSNKEIRRIDLLNKAFSGNPAFEFSKSVEGALSNPIHYFVFKNEVVQYFADNLHDIYGNRNTLYEDIAREILGETDGVCFCTQSNKPMAVG